MTRITAVLCLIILIWMGGAEAHRSYHSSRSYRHDYYSHPYRGHGYSGGGYLRQGYESYFGQARPYPETICVPVKDAKPDRYTFVHPDLGPEYLCRVLH